MLNHDTLFVRTMEDLETRCKSNDVYEILMIAGLLRKLLLDGSPLVDLVNRKRKQKIHFIANNRSVPVPDFWSIEDGFDPDTAARCVPLEVTKNELLSRPVLKHGNEIFTVRELILHIAHVGGAIHSGTPKTNKDKILKELGETMFIGGLPAGLRTMRAIGRVVVKGLERLKLQILSGA